MRPTWDTTTTSVAASTSVPPTSTTDDDERETTVPPTTATTAVPTTTGPTTTIAPTTTVVASTATTAASPSTLPGVVESTNSCDQSPGEAAAAVCTTAPAPTLPRTGGEAGPEVAAALVLAGVGAFLVAVKRRFV